MTVAEDVDLEEVAERLDGYSGADITNVCRDASLMSMRRLIEGLHPSQIKGLDKSQLDAPITRRDFEAAVAKVQPSVGKADLKRFEQWMTEYGAT